MSIEAREYEKLNNKEYIINNITFKLIPIVITIITLLMILLIELAIFKKCIEIPNTINKVSLGAILATFGSAILAIFLVVESNKYSRITTNVNILFKDILRIEPWRRWQFLKRLNYEKTFDDKIVRKKLDNPKCQFNVGSHEINVSIPTVREDFYDLSAIKFFMTMHKNRKHFKTYTYKLKNVDFKNTQYESLADCIMAWDCVYDIWFNVLVYKFSHYLLKVGTLIIFISVILSFYYEKISSIIKIG